LAYFKELTTGKTVIMGRETLSTLPRQQPLKNRTNIIMTRDEDFMIENGVILHSIQVLLDYISIYENQNDVFVIGGQSIYEQLLPYVDICYVTKIYHNFTADRFFPNLDQNMEWELKSSSSIYSENGVNYQFTVYEKIKK
jgi:dihydrofolate reductase